MCITNQDSDSTGFEACYDFLDIGIEIADAVNDCAGMNHIKLAVEVW